MRIFTFLLIIVTISSCNSDFTKKSKLSVFSQKNLEIEIINSVLKELIPKGDILNTQAANSSDTFALSIYINETLLIASKDVINEFVKKGANELLFEINEKRLKSKDMKCWLLQGFDDINVTCLAPLTSNEQNRTIGGANFSRIIFNDNKTKAAFIFDFGNWRNKNKSVFCAIEVEKKHSKWKILSRVCLEKKFPYMLSEELNQGKV